MFDQIAAFAERSLHIGGGGGIVLDQQDAHGSKLGKLQSSFRVCLTEDDGNYGDATGTV
jgi:hypothetical protein